jgi:phosphatidate cytidylyltransferase
VTLGLLGALELHRLLAPFASPPRALCLAGVCAVLLANWPARVGFWGAGASPLAAWRDVAGAFAAVVVAAFLAEMATYREPGGSVLRIAFATWVVAYLGVLPSFLAQLRWDDPPARGVTALALVIFVPKFGDVGAFFTGRALGRHKMTAVLSPKKTWEGLAGGLLAAVLTAVGLNRALARVLQDDWSAAGFGLAVGLAGVFGDLAESLIKRDCRRKDASGLMPGFGGVLDVVDSIVFAAPVAYWWLKC